MKKAMIEQLVLGMVGTNTWLIKNKESNELLIIDPADESARIEEKIDRMGGIPVAVLLTHGHFDHMLAADDLRDEYGIPIIACAAEQQVLTDSIKNLSRKLGKCTCPAGRSVGLRWKKTGTCRIFHRSFPYTGTYSGKLLLLSAGRRSSVFR